MRLGITVDGRAIELNSSKTNRLISVSGSSSFIENVLLEIHKHTLADRSPIIFIDCRGTDDLAMKAYGSVVSKSRRHSFKAIDFNSVMDKTFEYRNHKLDIFLGKTPLTIYNALVKFIPPDRPREFSFSLLSHFIEFVAHSIADLSSVGFELKNYATFFSRKSVVERYKSNELTDFLKSKLISFTDPIDYNLDRDVKYSSSKYYWHLHADYLLSPVSLLVDHIGDAFGIDENSTTFVRSWFGDEILHLKFPNPIEGQSIRPTLEKLLEMEFSDLAFRMLPFQKRGTIFLNGPSPEFLKSVIDVVQAMTLQVFDVVVGTNIESDAFDVRLKSISAPLPKRGFFGSLFSKKNDGDFFELKTGRDVSVGRFVGSDLKKARIPSCPPRRVVKSPETIMGPPTEFKSDAIDEVIDELLSSLLNRPDVSSSGSVDMVSSVSNVPGSMPVDVSEKGDQAPSPVSPSVMTDVLVVIDPQIPGLLSGDLVSFENLKEKAGDFKSSEAVTFPGSENGTKNVEIFKTQEARDSLLEQGGVMCFIGAFGNNKEEYTRVFNRVYELKEISEDDRAEAKSRLQAEFPYVEKFFDVIDKHLWRRKYFRLPPILVVGSPGIGKSRFLKRLLEEYGIPHISKTVGGVMPEGVIGGLEQMWRGAHPCLAAEIIWSSEYANPAIILEEVDKAATGRDSGNIVDVLNTFLDTSTSTCIQDPFLNVSVDCSHVTWLLTANTLGSIPAPIMDKCMVIHFETPRDKDLLTIANNCLDELLRGRDLCGFQKSDFHFVQDDVADLQFKWKLDGGNSIRKLQKYISEIYMDRSEKVIRGEIVIRKGRLVSDDKSSSNVIKIKK